MYYWNNNYKGITNGKYLILYLKCRCFLDDVMFGIFYKIVLLVNFDILCHIWKGIMNMNYKYNVYWQTNANNKFGGSAAVGCVNLH